LLTFVFFSNSPLASCLLTYVLPVSLLRVFSFFTGSVLAGLPVPATVGKLLLFGLVFRITTPIVAIAARICERCPFSSNEEDRFAVNKVRASYAGSSRSDLIGFWNLYQDYRNARYVENDEVTSVQTGC
jgi:hypothetical protein